MLLDRKAFTAGVFARDQHHCVLCGVPAVDAHHILDRKLFADGGYRLSNGASLCAPCHMRAETTEASVEEIRTAVGIIDPTLPLGFSAGVIYDKWGNEIRADGTRSRGPLFGDDGARKALGRLIFDGTFGWS